MQAIIEFPQQFLPGENKVFLSGPAGKIEAITRMPKDGAINKLIVICHPHPLHQGTMYNKVVHTVEKAFFNLGFHTVRFNYRGVGLSDGEYGNFVGEIEDLKAVLAWAKATCGDCRSYLAGFSFGSFVAASVAAIDNSIEKLLTIAPAVHHADYESLPPMHCPWLLVQPEKDEVVPPHLVYKWQQTRADVELHCVPDSSHFFHSKLIELRNFLENYYSTN